MHNGSVKLTVVRYPEIGLPTKDGGEDVTGDTLTDVTGDVTVM